MIGEFVVSGAILVAIFVVLFLRARAIMVSERGRLPGTPPGTGYTVIRSEYFSGGGGGGQAKEYKIPKNTDEYARLFVRGSTKQRNAK